MSGEQNMKSARLARLFQATLGRLKNGLKMTVKGAPPPRLFG